MNKQNGIASISMSSFQITDTISYQSKRSSDIRTLKKVLKMCLHRFGFPECLNYIKCYNNFVRINNINYNGFDKKQVINLLEMLQTEIIKNGKENYD